MKKKSNLVLYIFYLLFSLIASPGPATMFQVIHTTSSSIKLTWVEQFNGNSNITGAILEYSAVGSDTAPVRVVVGRQMWNLTGLAEFTIYRVSLFLKNKLGLSTPVSLNQKTNICKLYLLINIFVHENRKVSENIVYRNGLLKRTNKDAKDAGVLLTSDNTGNRGIWN